MREIALGKAGGGISRHHQLPPPHPPHPPTHPLLPLPLPHSRDIASRGVAKQRDHTRAALAARAARAAARRR